MKKNINITVIALVVITCILFYIDIKNFTFLQDIYLEFWSKILIILFSVLIGNIIIDAIKIKNFKEKHKEILYVKRDLYIEISIKLEDFNEYFLILRDSTTYKKYSVDEIRFPFFMTNDSKKLAEEIFRNKLEEIYKETILLINKIHIEKKEKKYFMNF